MGNDLKKKVINGSFWAFLERISVQGVSFVITMILARLLLPSDYGTIAMIGIFTLISGVLVDSGLGSALVQKKDSTEIDFNSVFYASVALSLILYAILYLGAPYIAEYYELAELCPILRFVSINLIFNGISSVQNAEVSRKMLFHLSFRISLLSTCASAVVGIVLAFLHYGAWALAWSSVTASAVGVASRWFIIGWRPKLLFSISALKSLFSYGWKISASVLIDTSYRNAYGLIIGKCYSAADLAFVNKGQHVPQLAMETINHTLSRVAFPTLVQMQQDRKRLRCTMQRMIKLSTFCVFPLMAIMAVCAKPLVLILYGQNWIEAVPYIQIACFTYAIWPLHTINLQGIEAIGRSDVFLKLEIIKKIVGILVICVFFRQGVLAFMIATSIFGSILGVLINSFPNRKLLNYTFMQQFRDVLPSAILAVGTAIVLFVLSWLPVSPFVLLPIQVLVAIMLVLSVSILFRLEPMKECVELFYPFVATKFGNTSYFEYVKKVRSYMLKH